MTQKQDGTTALLLIAHGSRNPRANQDIVDLAKRFLQRGHSITESCFLELAPPTIEDGGAKCVEQGAQRVVMLPYFLSAGVHVVEDLLEARNTMSERFPNVQFILAKPLGPHTMLEELLVLRLDEALASSATS
jgi:sirohydrochlorin ferrochelatase